MTLEEENELNDFLDSRPLERDPIEEVIRLQQKQIMLLQEIAQTQKQMIQAITEELGKIRKRIPS